MSKATTTRPVNLYQLSQEIGGKPALRSVGPDSEGVTLVRAEGVSQATLAAKVAAHVADPNVTPPPSVEQTNADTIRERAVQALEANRTFLAKSNAQMDAQAIREQTKALTRQVQALIRTMLNDYGGTD